MIFKILINGYAILITAILANIFADLLKISTWYKFIYNCNYNGLRKTLYSESFLNLLWLFIFYPIILAIGYMIGNEIYYLITSFYILIN